MGLYERYILPRMLDLTCGAPPIRKQREKVVPKAYGRVLEIGIGSGLNLAHYDPTRVDVVIGLDPSPGLRAIAARRARKAKLAVEWLDLTAERIPLADASIDSIVITYTLCTISDTAAAMSEMRRVLKPGGELYFSEHGRAPHGPVARLQDRVTPFWKKLAGGCALNRDIPALLRDSQFELLELETMYVPRTPRIVGHTFWGRARPASAPSLGQTSHTL
jgi:ubiquinone/menaquinone biosynthesis C-methylase UbiE